MVRATNTIMPSNRTAPNIREKGKSVVQRGRPTFAPMNPDAHKMTNKPGQSSNVQSARLMSRNYRKSCDQRKLCLLDGYFTRFAKPKKKHESRLSANARDASQRTLRRQEVGIRDQMGWLPPYHREARRCCEIVVAQWHRRHQKVRGASAGASKGQGLLCFRR